MADLALYRKWRSKNFEELVGQPHITQTLHNAVRSGKIAHAYLFCGPRGTGKTSTAKIFAKALNCEKGPTPTPCGECDICRSIQNGSVLDCIEIDAASNRGIDEIRDLREKIKFPPTVCRYKVYIIDEVHMLTPEAFNALLKTLEEPPPQTVFILCTTEPHKLLPTVASRCQRFDFRKISTTVVQSRLESVAQAEGLQMEPGVAPLIARASEGSLRDALSLLDQLRTFCGDKIEKEQAMLLLGQTPRDMIGELVGKLAEKNLKQLLIFLQQFLDRGADLNQIVRDLVNEFRRHLLWKVAPEAVEVTEEEKSWLKESSSRFQTEELYRILRQLGDLRNELRASQYPQLSAEIALMRIVHLEWEPSLEGLKRKIEILEERIASGAPASPRPAAAQQPAPAQQPAARTTPAPQTSTAAAQAVPAPRAAQPAAPATRPASPPAQPAPREEAAVTLDEIQSRWGELLEKMKGNALFPTLLDAKPVRLEGKVLTLAFTNPIVKNRLEQKKEEILRILKEHFGVSFQLLGDVQSIDHETFVQEAEKLFFEETLVAGDPNA